MSRRTRSPDGPCTTDRDDRYRDRRARQRIALGEQGERAGSAARDGPLDRPGDCQCAQGPGHRPGAVQERPAPVGMDGHRAGERFDRSSRRGSPRRATAICAHYSSMGAMAVVRQAQKRPDKHPGSRSCSAACRLSRRRSRSPIRPRGSPGPSWSTAAFTRLAIEPPNIEPRLARLPDKRLGDGVIAAAAAHDCNARARGKRRRASQVCGGAHV